MDHTDIRIFKPTQIDNASLPYVLSPFSVLSSATPVKVPS
ncbi:hypothetical protein FITA111629_00015 [Filibacter tadaridae]|uniref:Uncharacterized protein n=1 Tax=Filibacter tadaridae TaxID=2483811 RepID=A0A3P5XF04_9BACL|nr:hypothetical protein FILTAD_01852 [Filibacter tadaridae]